MTWPPTGKRNEEPREYSAPPELFEPLHQEFGFTLDVAASPTNALVARFFTKAEDALTQDWGRETVWCHPPNKNLGRWVQKAREAQQAGATVVMLLPARTGSKWWHEFVMKWGEIRFHRGRVKFVKPDGSRAQAPFDSVIVVFRRGRGREQALGVQPREDGATPSFRSRFKRWVGG